MKDFDPLSERVLTRTLDLLPVTATEFVGRLSLQSMRLSVEDASHLIAQGLAFQLHTVVAADRVEGGRETHTFRFAHDQPATWWEMWKERYADRWWAGWLVRRRPVRYERHHQEHTLTLDIARWRTFPKANFDYPAELGPSRQFIRITDKTRVTDWREYLR